MPSSPMDATKNKNKPIKIKKKMKPQQRSGEKKSPPPSWGAMRIFSSCKDNQSVAEESKNNNKKKSSRNISICGRKESSVFRNGSGNASSSSRSLKAPNDMSAAVSASSSFSSATSVAATSVITSSSSSSALSSPPPSLGGSFRAMQLRKLSSCYECHSVVDPSSFMSAFPCSDCDEIFMKVQSLELHRATRHAVSELGPEDTSRNIVEIIFQSSWLKKQTPVCKIDRILKAHNTDKTIKKFEDYKECIKEKASRQQAKIKNPRCVADGNELLRFHCTTFTCSLGLDGATSLCQPSSPRCNLCSIIKDGFRVDADGKIPTMATSGRAHDMARVSPEGEKRAMLVCRVIAGMVKKSHETTPEEGDSVTSCPEGIYSDFDELFVFNPRAILPCFVVIYSGY